MVKSIKRRTQAQTPAPKKDRIKGSAKNPKGSASGSRGGIEINEKALKALENMRDAHNAKFKSAKRTVNLGSLKAVYRRGAGAFSVSHRPGMTRNQWALARVKTFLKLVATGQRKKAYTGDLDLLPKGHPQKREAEKKSELLSPKKYSHIDFTPPKAAQEAGARALKVRAEKPESQRGMTAVGIARARDLANGKTMSPETVKRMYSYLSRHEVDKKSSTWKDQGKGWQAWNGWGGDAGFSWSKKVVNQMNAADKKANALRAFSESPVLAYDIPEGLTIGKPFKTLGIGQVSSRLSGENVGKEIDSEMLEEMVRVFRERRQKDPVIIDWQHATSPYQNNGPASPEVGGALGQIIELELKQDGLYATPAYNEKGLKVVSDAGGVLWSSPEFLAGGVHDRLGGSKIGDAQLLAITLTPRPAQSHDQIDRVTLNEKGELMDNLDSMSPEEKDSLIKAKDEMIKELQEQLNQMKKENEASLRKDEDDKEKMSELKEDEDDKDKKMSELKEDEDDKDKKMSEKKDYKMSEDLTSSVLLSEVNTLKEQLNQQSQRVEKLEEEKLQLETNSAVDMLLREGKISPAEKTTAREAYKFKESNPVFWQMFSERSKGHSVPLDEVGHGASGQEISKQTADIAIKAIKAEKNVSYSEALNIYRANNPQTYSQIFGG